MPARIHSTFTPDDLVIEDLPGEFTASYHKGRPSRADGIPVEQREFIAWDGEGANLGGEGKPQDYILFGCSTGDYLLSEHHLSFFDCIDLMLDVGRKNPQAIHVAYSFNYDANQIVRTLFERSLIKLHRDGHLFIRRPEPNNGRYRLEWRSGKWFQITRYGEKHDSKTNPNDKQTVRIYDIFSFFATSFVNAYTSNIGPIPEVVEQGKIHRNDFAVYDSEYVETYWKAEIHCIKELAEELRRRLYGAGLRISQWHGPGALANYALSKHNIKDSMSVGPDDLRKASRYAFAAGRFELFSLGREHRGKIYSLDINSAYPHGIRQLPALSRGRWQQIDGESVMARRSFAQFGVYHIRMLHKDGKSLRFRPEPSPLFHRDKLGNISYQWTVNGWYWAPEAQAMVKSRHADFTIVEGWEFYPDDDDDKPFAWVEDMYNTRREWKAQGLPSQLALKLCLNSLYGKTAQRVGWDKENNKGPAWHQLEWAGWVTSNCRAMLWSVLRKLPYSSLIAVETDGIYTTTNPAELGITDSKELGGWEVKEYDEMMYVQSGTAWLRKGDEWTTKRRGLDAETFTLKHCQDYLRSLKPGSKWEDYEGRTTRFIGIGTALQSSTPTKERLGVWETTRRGVGPGKSGKRVHMASQCRACHQGNDAYETRHDLLINAAMAFGQHDSKPHDIPWEGEIRNASWRNPAEEGFNSITPEDLQ